MGVFDHVTTEEMNVSYNASNVTVLVTGRLNQSDFMKLVHSSSTPLEMRGDQSAFEALFDKKVFIYETLNHKFGLRESLLTATENDAYKNIHKLFEKGPVEKLRKETIKYEKDIRYLEKKVDEDAKKERDREVASSMWKNRVIWKLIQNQKNEENMEGASEGAKVEVAKLVQPVEGLINSKTKKKKKDAVAELVQPRERMMDQVEKNA